MTKAEYDDLEAGDVVASKRNLSNKVIIKEGSPMDPLVQIHRSRLEDTFGEYEIVAKKKREQKEIL